MSTCGAKVWIFVCVHEGGNICLCICVLVVYVYVSGRALDSASLNHLSRPPPHHHALLVEDAAGALVISSRRAGCSGERRPTLGGSIGGAWPYWPCWAPIVGWGAFGSPGPGPGPPWGGRLPVEPAGLPPRHPGRLHCGLSEVPPSGSPLPFSGWRPRCPCGGSPGGPVPWGSLDVWGPGLFRACFMPCGMGLLFPTHTIKHYMEEPYEHKRAHTHKCTLKHSHWYKNRCSQTHIVLICCCFKTYFVILVMCAA